MFARMSLVLLLFVSGVVPAESPLRAQNPPVSTNKSLPADLDKEVKRVRKLAEKALPSLEELRKKNDWKLPWEFTVMFEDRYSGRVTEEQYWRQLAQRLAFVGLTAEEAKRRMPKLEDFYKRNEKYLGPFSKRDLCRRLLYNHRLSHPTSPTNAVAIAESLALTKVDNEMDTQHFKKPPTSDEEQRQWEQLRNRRLLDLQRTFDSELNDEQLAERVVQTLALIQKSTRLRFLRTNKWDELTRLNDVLLKRFELLDDFYQKLRTTTNADKLRKDLDISMEKTWELFTDEWGLKMNFHPAAEKRQIRWSTVTVTVREVALDALHLLPDLTEASAALLEVKLNALYKDSIKARAELEEGLLERVRKGMKETKDKITVESSRVELERREKRWRVHQAATFKVRMLDKGQNSHVISTRNIPTEWERLDVSTERLDVNTEFTYHWASIRNGIVVADISMKSNLPEAEVNRDLEFFVNVMHEKTVYGRIEDEAPKTPGSGK